MLQSSKRDAAGGEVVLSEDLSDREDYARVRVENPFREKCGVDEPQ